MPTMAHRVTRAGTVGWVLSPRRLPGLLRALVGPRWVLVRSRTTRAIP